MEAPGIEPPQKVPRFPRLSNQAAQKATHWPGPTPNLVRSSTPGQRALLGEFLKQYSEQLAVGGIGEARVGMPVGVVILFVTD